MKEAVGQCERTGREQLLAILSAYSFPEDEEVVEELKTLLEEG